MEKIITGNFFKNKKFWMKSNRLISIIRTITIFFLCCILWFLSTCLKQLPFSPRATESARTAIHTPHPPALPDLNIVEISCLVLCCFVQAL